MASIQGRLLELAMRLTGQKESVWRLSRRLAAERAAGSFSGKRRNWLEAPEPPRRMRRRYRVSASRLDGREVFVLAPRDRAGEKRILYLHGGAYVMGFIRGHWRFIGRLIDELGCAVVAPDYPLAPEHTYRDVFAMLLRAYRGLLAEVDPDDLILMGDSAGGGLALALAQELRGHHLPQPGRIVLLSPWLDVTMTHPAIAELDPVDPIVSVKGCIAAGRMYAGDADTRDPRISPLYGDLRALAPITLFVGTRDVLVGDCRKLRTRAAAEGVTLDYRESPGMLHDWMLLGIPESAPAIEQIVALVREGRTKGVPQDSTARWDGPPPARARGGSSVGRP